MKLGATANAGVQEALRKLNDEPLPAQSAFRMRKILDVCERERADFIKVRTTYVEKYANRNDDGSLKLTERGEPTFAGENIKIFTTVHNELCFVDVPLPTQIKMSDLPDKVKISAKEIALLSEPDVGVLDLDGYTPPPLVDKTGIELPDAVTQTPAPQATDTPADTSSAADPVAATTDTQAAASVATPTAPAADAALGPDPVTASVNAS